VASGIHIAEYQKDGRLDPALLSAFLEKHGHQPVAVIDRLV